ncbi:MAG: c-type cytochrome biogenesis protein CcmI [Moraxella sp.]|nr:c-type cytochrome biogenesis protein CcmI [Moraxella sp.]
MTPTIMLFLSLAVLLAVLMAVVVIVPWLKGRATTDNQLMALNVQVFGERLAELEADKQARVIDNTHYDAQVIELKKQLLAAAQAHEGYAPASVKSRAIVIVWVVLLALMAYFLAGDRTPVFKLWAGNDSVGQVADDLLTGRIDMPPEWATADSAALISAMQVNVHHNAHDPNRWMRLSELFMSLEAAPQAIEALSRAYRLEPDNQEIASTYAQISFFTNDGRLDATSRSVLQKLLTQNPNHEGAQMLMAMGETRAGNFEQAQGWVSRLRSLIAAKSGNHSTALASLDEMSATINNQAAAQASGVQIVVQVDNAMLSQVNAEDVLFVSVADVAGGPPYAAVRVPVSELKNGQLTLSLSDNNAMLPERTISAARNQGVQLAVNARISKSGTANSQADDLSANPVLLSKTQNQATIIINQRVP